MFDIGWSEMARHHAGGPDRDRPEGPATPGAHRSASGSPRAARWRASSSARSRTWRARPSSTTSSGRSRRSAAPTSGRRSRRRSIRPASSARPSIPTADGAGQAVEGEVDRQPAEAGAPASRQRRTAPSRPRPGRGQARPSRAGGIEAPAKSKTPAKAKPPRAARPNGQAAEPRARAALAEPS